MARKIALLVGVSTFEDETLQKLHSPEPDIKKLRSLLSNPDIGGYDVEVLLDANLRDAQLKVRDFFRTPAESLLFYFAGHGIRDANGILRFPLKDTKMPYLDLTAMGGDFLRGQWNDSLCRRQIIIIDCCFSGAVLANSRQALLGSSVGASRDLSGDDKFLPGQGRAILTASDSFQYAIDKTKIEGEYINSSVFSRHLIEGLETGEADLDDDGEVSVDDLFSYVTAKVGEETSLQRPGRTIEGQHGSLWVARNPRRTSFLLRKLVEGTRAPTNHEKVRAIEQLRDLATIAKPEIAAEVLKIIGKLRDHPVQTVKVEAEHAFIHLQLNAAEQAKLAKQAESDFNGSDATINAFNIPVQPPEISARVAQAVSSTKAMGRDQAAEQAAMVAKAEEQKALEKLGAESARDNAFAPDALGGYSRKRAAEYFGEYVCARPYFDHSNDLIAYIMELSWSETESCMVFQEKERSDPKYTQRGHVYMPQGQPYNESSNHR